MNHKNKIVLSQFIARGKWQKEEKRKRRGEKKKKKKGRKKKMPGAVASKCDHHTNKLE